MCGDSEYPQIADVTAPFVYARIMGAMDTEPNGYSSKALDLWAERARQWASGGAPADLETVTPQQPGKTAAGGLPLRHQRLQGTQSCSRNGANRAAAGNTLAANLCHP